MWILFTVAVALAGTSWSSTAPTITNTSDYVTLTANDSPGVSSMTTAKHWSDGLAAHSGTNYLVQSSSPNWFSDIATFALRTPAATMTFPGDSLTLDNGCLLLKLNANQWVTFNQLNLYGCNIVAANEGIVSRIKGAATVYGTSENPSAFSVSGDRRICLDATLAGDEDALILIGHTPGVDPGRIGSVYVYGGTNSNANYKGRWRVVGTGSDSAPIMLDFWGNAFGTYSSATSGKPLIETSQRAWLRFQGSILGSDVEIVSDGDLVLRTYGGSNLSGRWSNEGFYLTDGAWVHSTAGGSLVMGTDNGGAIALGKCRIDGFDKMELTWATRFAPEYNNPTLPVHALNSTGMIADSCANLGPVVLQDAGSLSPGVGNDSLGVLEMASLTVQEENDGIGYLRYSVLTPTATTMTTDVVRVKGNFTNETGRAFPICFENYAQKPVFGAGTVYPILSAANLDEYGADDFTLEGADGTMFVKHQLEGAFEVRKINEVPTLCFVQSSPGVVTLTGQDNDGVAKDSFNKAGKWNLAEAPSNSYDYVVPVNTMLRCSSAGASTQRTFLGRSLAINGGDLALKPQTVVIDDLRLYSGAIISIRSDGTTVLRGNVSVYADQDNPAAIWGYANRTFRLESTLHGDGAIRVRHYASLASPTTPCSSCLVLADNSDFTGRWEFYQPSMLVDFASAAAIGGPADAFSADRIRLTSNAVWRCSASFTVADPTCGITLGVGDAAKDQDGGTIRVEPSQTLTLNVPIAGVTTLRKKGTGTLALGCDNPFSGKVQLLEGVLSVGSSNSLAKATLLAASGSQVRVEAEVGATFKSVAAFTDGRTVRVSSAMIDKNCDRAHYSATLLRFLNTTEFDVGKIDFDASSLHDRKVSLETVADGTDLLVKVGYVRMGTVIVLR